MKGDECYNFLNVSREGIAFFGPLSNSHHVIMAWDGGPKRILLLAKPDPEIIPALEESLEHLWNQGLVVYVEESVYSHMESRFGEGGGGGDGKAGNKKLLRVFKSEAVQRNQQGIDLIITFGGDGLLMHCNSLYGGRPIPPIMSFDFGSLGFLAPFNYENFVEEINNVLTGSVLLTLRMRLECSIRRRGEELPSGSFHVLNEALIDRGPASFLSVIDIQCDSEYLTTVQGDGIIIATPTGSTAYSLAAGGSMVHPSVPAILVTPICAHTLSFRPLLLPDSCTLECSVPMDCRANGWVSFDGKFRQELERGDSLVIHMSNFPMPTINNAANMKAPLNDWFSSLRNGFLFNQRPRQKSEVRPPISKSHRAVTGGGESTLGQQQQGGENDSSGSNSGGIVGTNVGNKK